MKFKLLKDLPGIKAGTIGEERDSHPKTIVFLRNCHYGEEEYEYYPIMFCKAHPDFFEEVKDVRFSDSTFDDCETIKDKIKKIIERNLTWYARDEYDLHAKAAIKRSDIELIVDEIQKLII